MGLTPTSVIAPAHLVFEALLCDANLIASAVDFESKYELGLSESWHSPFTP